MAECLSRVKAMREAVQRTLKEDEQRWDDPGIGSQQSQTRG